MSEFTLSGECEGVDRAIDKWLAPGDSEQNDQRIDATVREIVREVQDMHYAGAVKPFREGEPIGACPRRVVKKKLTKDQIRKFHNERMTRHREDMLALREQNDAEIAAILGVR